MRSTDGRLRPARTVAAAATLVVLFVVAPAHLAGGDHTSEGALRGAVRGAFAGFWGSGGGELTPAMRRIADYWLRYHLAKAIIAAVLLAVLVPLGVRLWRMYVGAPRRRLLLGGVLVTGLALAALVLVMANLQGAAAPFASLLPLLVDTPPDAPLAAVLSDVRQQLTGVVHAHQAPSPALARMIDDYALYHWVIAVIAAVVAAGLLSVGVVLWRRRGPSGPARRVLAAHGVLFAVVALALAVVVAANVGTALDPDPAFAAFIDGGW
ncbi:hypothetical protein [Dactylosporangium sp. NPDC006015]|uniref:hypothetical protein n=1 Tax=Dactylosporangium sp. NPDC006015 TaxID=3154576 RepID=UPI0033A44854